MSSLASSKIMSPSTEFSPNEPILTELVVILLHVDELEPLDHIPHRPALRFLREDLKDGLEPLVDQHYKFKSAIPL